MPTRILQWNIGRHKGRTMQLVVIIILVSCMRGTGSGEKEESGCASEDKQPE